MFALMASALAVSSTPPAEQSVIAAVGVIHALYAALNQRDYRSAFALWNGGRTYGSYKAGYRHTAHVKVTPLAPFTIEGGMGHSWAEIRVHVDAVLADGRPQRFEGKYTLSRVNDIDGSTATQRRWHIVAARLKPLPAGG